MEKSTRQIPADRGTRGGLRPDAAKWVGPLVGLVMLAAATTVSRLVFENNEGPFGPLGWRDTLPKLARALVAYGLGVAAGLAAFAAMYWAARRSMVLVVLGITTAIGAGIVLWPQQIDSHESFMPRPNERYTCQGWTFAYYPPDTMDASSDVYCIGLERRTTDG